MSSRISGFKAQDVSTPRGTPAKPSAPTSKPAANDGWAAGAKPRREVTGRGVALNVPQPAPEQRLLRAGLSGNDVKAMQEKLGIAATGTFDAATLRAVKDFQSKHGLQVDGLVGPKTLAALANAARPQAPQKPGEVRTPEKPQTPVEVRTPEKPQTPHVHVDSDNHGPSVTPSRPSVTTPTSTRGGVSEAALGDPAARLALARELVKPMGSATQADVDAVVAEAATMPLSELQDLKRARINFVACRDSVADAYPRLLSEHPRGWPPGRGWADVPGAYMPTERSVVVATRQGPDGGRQVFPSGDKHGSASLALHEGGHAVDAARGYASINDPDFQRAYQADLAAGRLGAYYTQGGDAGASEGYAESHALFLTGDPNGEGARAFPKMMEYWATRSAAGAPS